MAFELTPSAAGKSLAFLLIAYVVAFVFQMYSLYLNWKQSKVKDTTTILVKEVQAIRKMMEEARKK